MPVSEANQHNRLEALGTLEKDLHQHIHLENKVLFPRRLELEQTWRGSAGPRVQNATTG
jgi:hypothetical protein